MGHDQANEATADGADRVDGADGPITHVVMIGLMASGKSSAGRGVARRIGWPFIDVDDAIEAMTGETVAELWERGGQEAYRPLERAVVLDALGSLQPNVLAAPGGVVLDERTRDALRGDGVLAIYLRADPSVLARRIENDEGHTRPLVDDDPEGVMDNLFDERDRLYAELADEVVQVDRLTPDQVVHAVLHLVIRSTAESGAAALG